MERLTPVRRGKRGAMYPRVDRRGNNQLTEYMRHSTLAIQYT